MSAGDEEGVLYDRTYEELNSRSPELFGYGGANRTIFSSLLRQMTSTEKYAREVDQLSSHGGPTIRNRYQASVWEQKRVPIAVVLEVDVKPAGTDKEA